MTDMNVLILSSQSVPLDKSEDANYPLFLSEFAGKSVLEQVVDRTRGIEKARYAFAFQEHHIRRFHVDNIAHVLVPKANVISMPQTTQGSACTALYAACMLDPEIPILIVSSNEIVKVDFAKVVAQFQEQDFDAATLTFRSIHPRYSFVRTDDNDLIVEVAQRNPISDKATTGIFWYKMTSDFVEGAKQSIRKNATTSDQYFIAPVFNQLVLKNKRIGHISIDQDQYIPLKMEDQLQEAKRRF